MIALVFLPFCPPTHCRVHIAGQSAGAHISSLALLCQAMKHAPLALHGQLELQPHHVPLPPLPSRLSPILSPALTASDHDGDGREADGHCDGRLTGGKADRCTAGTPSFEPLDCDQEDVDRVPLPLSSSLSVSSTAKPPLLSAVEKSVGMPASGTTWSRRVLSAGKSGGAGDAVVGSEAGRQVPWEHPRRPRGPLRTLSGSDLAIMGGDVGWNCSMLKSYTGIAGV